MNWSAQMADREPLTRQDVAEVAELALLNVTDEDLDRYTGQLDAVFDLAGKLNQFDVSDVPPTSHPFGLVNVFRPDSADSNSGLAHNDAASNRAVNKNAVDDVRSEALAGGPDVEDSQFKVPPALGESP